MKLSRVPQLQPLNDSPGSNSSQDSPPGSFTTVKGYGNTSRSPEQSPREWPDPTRTLSFGQSESDNSSKLGGLGGNAGANSKAAAALKLLRSSSPVENSTGESASDANDMEFVPSFFAGGDRNPRPRRGGNPGPRTVGLFNQTKSNSEPIDELDRILNNNAKPVSYMLYLFNAR